MKNNYALITGASRGIGKEIAKTFIAQGATVAFTYLSSDENYFIKKEFYLNFLTRFLLQMYSLVDVHLSEIKNHALIFFV